MSTTTSPQSTTTNKFCDECAKKAHFFSRAQQISPEKTCRACALISTENSMNDDKFVMKPISFTTDPTTEGYPSESITSVDDNLNENNNKYNNDNNEKIKVKSSNLLLLFVLSIITGIIINFSFKFFTSIFMATILT